MAQILSPAQVNLKKKQAKNGGKGRSRQYKTPSGEKFLAMDEAKKFSHDGKCEGFWQ